jgi:3-phosphoglycerate kinase
MRYLQRLQELGVVLDSHNLDVLRGKTVLLRIDTNGSLRYRGENGHRELVENAKVRDVAQSIKAYHDAGVERFVLLNHQGRKPDDDFIEDLHQVPEWIHAYTGIKFHNVNQVYGDEVADAYRSGKNVSVGNVRGNDSETAKLSLEQKISDPFTQFYLKLLGRDGTFALESSGVIHRPHLSVTVFPHVMKAYVGISVGRELKIAESVYEGIEHGDAYQFLVGGKKLDKIDYWQRTLEKNPNVSLYTAGLTGIAFVIADGKRMNSDTKRLVSEESVESAGKLIRSFRDRIYYPEDFVLGPSGQEVTIRQIENASGEVKDIGTRTLATLTEELKANSVLGGVVGVTEEGYRKSDILIRRVVTNNEGTTIIGESNARLLFDQEELERYAIIRGTNISAMGGAFQSFQAGDLMPPLEAFIQAKSR